MDALYLDLRHAVRTLVRDPAFTAAAVVTLALGIGANTAIFSVADEVLLRRPPVSEPDRLAAVYTTCRRGNPRCSSSYLDYLDYRDRATTFSDFAGYSSYPLNVGDDDAARLAGGHLVTGNYFDLLGVGARVGRVLQPRDDGWGAATDVAVLSYDFWRDQFGADPQLVGRTLRLNGLTYTVVGVTAEGFKGLDLATPADVFLPLFTRSVQDEPDSAAARAEVLYGERGVRWIQTLVGRLKPGVSFAQARQEMAAISAQLAEEYPDARAAQTGFRSITVDPAPRYILPVGSASDLKRFVWLLFGVVGATLLLAAANLANLLLVRASGRQREIGVRLAIGAGRGRLIRQLVSESVILALFGGAVGLIVASWMIDLLSGFQLPGGISIAALDISFDGRMFGFALALSLVTGTLFGLVPALQLTSSDLMNALRGPGATAARLGGQEAMRKALVSVQIALCLVLLVGSGLFIRTLQQSFAFDPGFRAERVALARFNLGLLRYTPDQTRSFVDRLLERVRALPSVSAASVATLVPFQLGGFRGTFVTVDGYEPAPDEEMRVDYVFIEPQYFEALGIRMTRGRPLSSVDRQGASPVVVINEEMARRYWPGRDPIGGTVDFGSLRAEVVGVAENPVWTGLGDSPSPFVFLPLAQSTGQGTVGGFLTLIARTTSNPDRLLPMLRREFGALDSQLSLSSLQTMEDQLAAAMMPQRMGAVLLTLLGCLALLLAAVGIYGVVGYSVARQAKSIAIRIALGARNSEVLWMLVRAMAIPILGGSLAGYVAVAALTRTVETFLFGVGRYDPLTFLVTGCVLCFVAFVATLVPARRALLIDPMKTLKVE